ncbi:fungal-specific transcription factor domain-containing protein [Bisporella sp. PMI_857]|nr:fungal-specific transcription factor domain-containing protein [Bisporella sp. PMI_857]
MDVENGNRRRRGAAFVTNNACNECKKKRAKCDGHNPCARCAAHGNVTCRYEIPVRASKESLKAEIDNLQAYRQSSQHILDSLASNKQREYILGGLQDGTSVEDISQGLEKREHLLDSSTVPFPGSEPNLNQQIGNDIAVEDSIQNSRMWTEVTTDTILIEHLISLYFCWEYPIFASLTRRHFLRDFHSGRRRYCSSLLLNAILAVGYQFSSDSVRSNGCIVAANCFSKEAERLLELEQELPSLTTIQALSIMSVFEASRGRSEQSAFYCGQAIRMVVELGLHMDVDIAHLPSDEREVRRATAWGAFALDHTWSLILRSIPHLSPKGFRAAKPSVLESEETFDWIPYTGEKDSYNTTLQQQGNRSSVYMALCNLFEVVHNSLYILHVPGKVLGSYALIDIYADYLAWHNSLPSAVRQGQNSTPPVFFIHIYYNFAILLLFCPFVRLRMLNSEIVPLEVCIQAAQTITSLFASYIELYSLRRTPCFMPILAMASNIMHAVHAEILGTPNLQFRPSLSILQEMAYSHGFARRGIKYLYILEQRTSLATGLQNESTTKESPYQHVRCSLNFLESGIEDLPPDQADPFCTSICAPFPSQVLPVVSHNIELQKLGFELINT